jgi:hypothetical protein
MPKKRKSTRKRLERVSIRAERRPEPDWDKFAFAMLQYARLLLAEQEAKKGQKDQTDGR